MFRLTFSFHHLNRQLYLIRVAAPNLLCVMPHFITHLIIAVLLLGSTTATAATASVRGTSPSQAPSPSLVEAESRADQTSESRSRRWGQRNKSKKARGGFWQRLTQRWDEKPKSKWVKYLRAFLIYTALAVGLYFLGTMLVAGTIFAGVLTAVWVEWVSLGLYGLSGLCALYAFYAGLYAIVEFLNTIWAA